MQANISGVIFDLDNTLLQSRLGAAQGLKTAATLISRHLSRKGYSYTQSQILRRLRLVEQKRRAHPSGLVPRILYDRDEWWKTLLKELHLAKLRGPWIHKTTLRYWDEYMRASPPFSDAEPTVKHLKKAGYRLALVSDSDGTPGMKKHRIERLRFRKLFETAVVAGDDTPRLKPSEGPFLLVAKRLGLPPKNCVYIGDNPETDILGAKAVGMTTILVHRRPYAVLPEEDPPDPIPTFKVKTLKQIPRILGR